MQGAGAWQVHAGLQVRKGPVKRCWLAATSAVAVGKVSRTVRHLLPEYGGYECKGPEPGKFTLASRWPTGEHRS